MNTAQQHQLEKQRHSLAHILAYAVKRLYSDTKIGIGPVTDTGFYYEFDSPHAFTSDDLHLIEEEMQKIIDEELPFTSITIPREQALQTLLQLGETYKTDLLSKIPDAEVSFYKTGDDFIDLCRGPHVKNTKELDHFKLIKISKSHWMNDTSRPVMQKIFGISFESKRKLDEYLNNLKKLSEISSIEIAESIGLLDQFSQSYLSYPILKERGIIFLDNLKNYLRQQMSEAGIQLLSFPLLSDNKGSIEKDFSKFPISKSLSIDKGKEIFYLTPNLEDVFIDLLISEEKLTRSTLGTISQYIQNDLINRKKESPKVLEDYSERHIALAMAITNTSESKDLIVNHIKLMGNILRALRFNQFKVILETPDYSNLSNYLYDEVEWDLAIDIFKSILTELKLPSSIREGRAEFFGPKITIEVKDKFSRTWQIGQITLDPSLPKHFKIGRDEKESKEKIFFLHTEVFSSMERVIDLILENGEGELPLWLSPHQVEIIPLENKYLHIATKIFRELKAEGIPTLLDDSIAPADGKITSALAKHVPYIIIIGEKEANTDAISVKTSSGQDLGLMRVGEFTQKIKTELRKELEE